mmetsp:Transcript_24385/g.44087  ORF Transcript_24385/g.44087 Transcript_24385/m.44087 type:complete len:92 (+) Transcript_24385:1325-1600(+)
MGSRGNSIHGPLRLSNPLPTPKPLALTKTKPKNETLSVLCPCPVGSMETGGASAAYGPRPKPHLAPVTRARLRMSWMAMRAASPEMASYRD